MEDKKVVKVSKVKDGMSAMSGFKRKEMDDPYMEKYGYYSNEVCCDYETLKKAKEIEADKKRMAAVKEYAENEAEEASEVAENVESKKPKGKTDGEEVYTKDDVEEDE